MNKHLHELISLSKFDKDIDALEPSIIEARKPIQIQNTIIENATEKLEIIKKEIETIKLDIAKHELDIDTQKAALDDTSKKRMEVKTERDNRALEAMEEVIKDKITSANETIEAKNVEKEHKEEELRETTEKITKANEQINEIKDEIEKKVFDIQTKQSKILDGKEDLAKTMDSKIVEFYEKIRKWAHNTSVVPVYKQACGGCYILLNDRIYAEIAKQDDIVTCPHCGRILYIDESQDKTNS